MAKLKELEKNIFYKKELVETGSQLDLVKWRFDELGMDLSDLTRIVYEHQHTYYSFLDKKECENAIRKVLKKREIQQILVTAINLDVLCEQGLLLEPLQSMVWKDEGTFGVDEVLIHSAQLFGSIGIANAYNLDKEKPGVIGLTDKVGKNSKYCNTFLDDALCVVCGAAMGKIAHSYGLEAQEQLAGALDDNLLDTL